MAAEGQKRLQKGVFGHLFDSLTPLCWDRKLFKNIIPLPNLLPADSGQLHLF